LDNDQGFLNGSILIFIDQSPILFQNHQGRFFSLTGEFELRPYSALQNSGT